MAVEVVAAARNASTTIPDGSKQLTTLSQHRFLQCVSLVNDHGQGDSTMKMFTMPSSGPGAAHALLRIVTGVMFMQHGVQKLFGWLLPPERAFNGAPELMSQMWFAGVLEVFGGAMIVLGLLTRPVAFLLAGQMAVAYFQAHFPRAFWPIMNGGESAVLFCFAFLFLFAAGAGPFSLDSLLRRKHVPETVSPAGEGVPSDHGQAGTRRSHAA